MSTTLRNSLKTTLNTTARAALLGAVAVGASAVALAGGSGDHHKKAALADWAREASAAVDQVMYYPPIAARYGKEGKAQYRLTIAADGTVIESQRLLRPSSSMLRSAANRVVKRVDLPHLPTGYDRLTVALKLNYAIDNGFSALGRDSRRSKVTTRQIAEAGGYNSVGFEIISGVQSGDEE